MSDNKNLNFGVRVVLQVGAKNIAEKVVRDSGSITIGQDSKATLSAKDAKLPGSEKVLDFSKSSLSVSGAGWKTSLFQNNDFSETNDKSFKIDSSGVNGKLEKGEISVLFKSVPLPDSPAKPQMIPEAENGIVKAMDRAYLIILALSIITHVSLAISFQKMDPPKDSDLLSSIPDRFAKLVMDKKKVEEAKKKKEKPKKKKEEKKQAVDKTKKAPPKPKEEKPKEEKPKKEAKKPAKKKLLNKDELKAKAERRSAKRKMVRKMGVLAILGSKAKGGKFSISQSMTAGVSAKNLDSQMKNLGKTGLSMATAADVAAARKGIKAEGKLATVAGLGSGKDVKDVGVEGGGGEVAVKAKVKSYKAEVEGGSLDEKKLKRVLKKKFKAIQRCYEKELKRNPGLKGKISIAITINTRGRVSDSSVARNTMKNKKVANCIKKILKRTRFPKPDGEVDITIPYFFTKQ